MLFPLPAGSFARGQVRERYNYGSGVAHVQPTPPFRIGRRYSAVNGSRAISLALLTARVKTRWCDAQVPVALLGRIFPLSEMYLRSLAAFL